MNKKVSLTPTSFLSMQEDFHQKDGHSQDLDQKRSGIPLTKKDQEENGTKSLTWWYNLEKVDTQFSEPRVHRSQGTRKIINTLLRWPGNDWNFFAQIFMLISSVSSEQSRICVKNTVAVMQERWDPCWQDNLTHCLSQQVCWRKHLHLRPRILHKKICCKSTKNEWKGSHNKTEWQRFVLMQDSWQQLNSDSTSWFTVSVACRECTLPRYVKSTDPKGWIRGNTKIGPVLEVTTSYLQGKYGVEIRMESVNKDNSHSWVRICHGLNKLVMALRNKEDDDNEQETSEMKFEDFALKTNVLAFASR